VLDTRLNVRNYEFHRTKNPPEGGVAVRLQLSDPIPNPYPKNWQNNIGDSES
jgi:hypothetical protein